MKTPDTVPAICKYGIGSNILYGKRLRDKCSTCRYNLRQKFLYDL